jgi:UDP-N-acetyl-D-mannosaminuronic acid dehydrogenase
MNSNAVSIIGGCGHVGLPLGLALADRGLDVTLYDVNERAVDLVNSGQMPFDEPGAPELLPRVVGTRLRATTDPTSIAACESVIVVIGTPVDEHLNPDPRAVPESVAAIAEHLRDGQLLVLRSTIYPGVTALVEQRLEGLGLKLDVAFCPERIAEARALTELYDLPQIVAARTDRARDRADALFRRLTEQTVHLTPEEAELAKLFTNTWRYIKFATANQLYMIANDFGLDFERIRTALAHDYPRAADLPGAGFAAGPCLFKDTMQLAAFHKNNFTLGHASMLVNEGLPLYVVGQLEREHDLSKLCVGILGMAFKAETDDTRSSLSYKLKRILRFKAREVLCTDPYVTTDPDLVPLEQVLERADILVVATPHRVYANLAPVQPVADVWNVLGQGVRV